MSKNIFNSVKLQRPKRNLFDLTHDVKLSCNMGQLVPIMCTEAIPGDKFNIAAESLVRFAPMVTPVMHRFDVSIHYFFVPNRLLWPNWENYITNTPNPLTEQLPVFPVLEINPENQYNYTKLSNYLGIPTPPDTGSAIQISALPFAAYQMIYDEYYRDQNLQTSVYDYIRQFGGPGYVEDGINANEPAEALTTLRTRAWEHDYFTSALPFAQKGEPVNLPLAGFEDVEVKLNTAPGTPSDSTWQDTNNRDVVVERETTDSDLPTGKLYAETSALDAGSTTINDLRKAFRLQEWLERMARGGSRYFEQILSMFGLRSPDSRLQRPEYIVGAKSPVVISEILQTSATGLGDSPQGNMSGHGLALVNGNFGGYFVQEHGYIMGIMSVMPKTAYFQGIPKHFLKTNDIYEFYWSQFANIGEQEIKKAEVYAYTANQNNVFGYTPRYAEYRFENNRVAGEFQSSLLTWHAARKFENEPNLNSAFIECNPTFRIFANETPEDDHLFCQVLNKVTAIRPIPKFGNPMM